MSRTRPEQLPGGGAASEGPVDPPAPLSTAVLDPILRAALDEDRGDGDVTSENTVPADARARARLVAKEAGVLAGLDAFLRTFELCDPAVAIERDAADGERVEVGQELARIDGNARALLLAERTALNVLQRLSGIASLTARYVEAVGDGGARVLDTRKTTPNLRVLEKYAVTCGGGCNHRMGLHDEAMVKENHLELAGRGLTEVLVGLRANVGPDLRITAEARDAAEARAAVRGGADVVLLDNMTPAQLVERCAELRALAEERGRPVLLEASGGITLATIAEFARTGVDRISVGALTHSAPALDLSLYLEPVR